MPARTPEGVHELFTQAFAAGDGEALVALYEPDAAFMPQPGQVVNGHAAIREAIGGFLALNAEFKMQAGTVVQAGDIALLLSKWTLSGTDPGGAAVELAGQTADVVRRQPDGSWLIVIDNPYGA
jgi:uncharacterized protein (TIGR02246 family)